jgi:hypothetical protein
MEAIRSSETSGTTQRTTRRHIPEEDTLQNHRCENLKFYNSVKIPLSLLGNGSVKIPLIDARQRLVINVTAVTNTEATIEELLDV